MAEAEANNVIVIDSDDECECLTKEKPNPPSTPQQEKGIFIIFFCELCNFFLLI